MQTTLNVLASHALFKTHLNKSWSKDGLVFISLRYFTSHSYGNKCCHDRILLKLRPNEILWASQYFMLFYHDILLSSFVMLLQARI